VWLYKLFYKNKKKVIPSENSLYNLLTPLALAIWIQDDGTWNNSGLRIATNCFKLNEIEILKHVLAKKFKIKSSIHYFYKSNQYQLYIKKESIDLLRNLTFSFFHESMLYKLGLNK
jgi:ubiquinol-cytochrome c reductase cytochrome b subunit